jgi:large subunit ribosomal protein L19
VNLVDVVENDYANANAKNLPSFRSGDTVVVHARIKEGAKSRVQLFQGMVISIERRSKIGGHFRVRKVSSGYGVERLFPFHSPNVEKVEVVQRGKARQSKLFYLRERSGKSARVSIDYERKD